MLLCERDEKERPVKYTDKLKRHCVCVCFWDILSDLPFLGRKKYFSCDPGESRYEPGALMKRAEYPANTLTGPRWLLGNKAKWLLSDLVCLSSTAAVHLWLWALLLSGQKLLTVESSPGISQNYTLLTLLKIMHCAVLRLASLAPFCGARPSENVTAATIKLH